MYSAHTDTHTGDSSCYVSMYMGRCSRICTNLQVPSISVYSSTCRFDPSRSKRQSIDPSSLPQNIIMPPRQPKGGLCDQQSSGSAKLVVKVSSILSGEPTASSDCVSELSSAKRQHQSSHLRKPPAPANGTQSQQPTCPADSSKDEVRMYICTNAYILNMQLMHRNKAWW